MAINGIVFAVIILLMKRKKTKKALPGFRLAAVLLLAALPLSFAYGSARGALTLSSQGDAAGNRQAVAKFEERVKDYALLREELEGKLPKLPKESTPEEIQAHKTAFEEIVRESRAEAKQGDLFTPDIAAHIRRLMRNELKGQNGRELRQTILEAETKGVPLRVNYSYPENKELTQIPPTLLLKLPQLPKQVRYRFVGRHLLLVDRENGLIIDYMLNALP
jgi:hypothetical protein